MTTRFFLVLTLCVILRGIIGAAPGDGDRPNILFVFADDYAFDCVHAHGNDEIETPNIDRLVNGGTTFTHAYNMGAWAGAVCVASRTMLITGRFLWNAHKVHPDLDNLYRETGKLWPQLMAKEGYDTYFSGKWHTRADATKAFKVARNVRPGMPNQTDAGYNRPIDGQPDPWSPFDRKFEGFWKGGVHWSEVLRDDAVDYLGQAGKSDKPFFMYIAFNAPHDPRQSPKEYVDKYPPSKVSMPRNFVPEYPYDIGSNKGRDETLAPFPRTENAVKVNRGEYYAIITHLDTQVGAILEALEKSGKADNTYIFFTADHGLAVGHHGLMGKQNMFDHSVRVPFVVTGPGIAKDATNSVPIYLQDVMATSLELAGAKKPDHVQFNSLLGLLQGKKKQHAYDAIYGGYMETQRMITRQGHKLILYPKIKKALLYNLDRDPDEMHNLAVDPKNQPLMKSLFARLLELQKENGDALDLNAAFPVLAPTAH
jgi:arylsulfatase A-like enzyme